MTSFRRDNRYKLESLLSILQEILLSIESTIFTDRYEIYETYEIKFSTFLNEIILG